MMFGFDWTSGFSFKYNFCFLWAWCDIVVDITCFHPLKQLIVSLRSHLCAKVADGYAYRDNEEPVI